MHQSTGLKDPVSLVDQACCIEVRLPRILLTYRLHCAKVITAEADNIFAAQAEVQIDMKASLHDNLMLYSLGVTHSPQHSSMPVVCI